MSQCCACTRELTLSELLEDPIVGMVMARDGVSRIELERIRDELPIRRTHEENQAATCACDRSE